jgi:predicted dehydrogenase
VRDLSGIGAAVIGSGFIGTVHVESLRRLGVQVHGLLGSSPERGAERATKLGVPRAYASLDELLADERVEVVHVTSPNQFHAPQASAALRAGRHVVCEKPLGMTGAETADLATIAAGLPGQVNAVCFNNRFYPLNQHVRAMVAAGELGDVRLVTGRYFQDWLLNDTDWNWRLDPAQGGSLRALGDIGSHWLDLTGFLTGLRPAEVMADMTTFIPVRRQPRGPVESFSLEVAQDTVDTAMHTEDAAAVLIRYPNGARGVMSVSQLSPGRKNSLKYELNGSRASAAWDTEQPDQLWIGRRDVPNETLFNDPRLMSAAGRATSALPAGHVEGFADAFTAMFRAIYADVARGGHSPDSTYATFAEGHAGMLILDAIAESARSGAWTSVAS